MLFLLSINDICIINADNVVNMNLFSIKQYDFTKVFQHT